MGTGRWSERDWREYSQRNISGREKVEDIYTSRSLNPDLDPRGITYRESCDSIDNPNATPIIIGLDVTGSMGFILDNMARMGLRDLATEIYNKKPINDPHLMFMGIGDVKCDSAPLQVTQFEADIRIAEALTKIYLEKGGGGNDCESYTLPWWFAAMHTKCDNYIKRGKKGFLFTIGDECPPEDLSSYEIERVLGYKPQFNTISTRELFRLVSEQYEVFHIVIEEGSYCRYYPERALNSWRSILGERVLSLKNHKDLANLIVEVLQKFNGRDYLYKNNEAERYHEDYKNNDFKPQGKRKIGFLRF